MEASGEFQMEFIPIELKLIILEYCPSGVDLAKLGCINKEWQGLVRSSGHLWEKMCYKMIESLPNGLVIKNLPPKGLNWKELCILWTAILKNKFKFTWFFNNREVDNLNKLLYGELPHLSHPVRYYNFGSDYGSDYSDYLDRWDSDYSDDSTSD